MPYNPGGRIADEADARLPYGGRMGRGAPPVQGESREYPEQPTDDRPGENLDGITEEDAEPEVPLDEHSDIDGNVAGPEDEDNGDRATIDGYPAGLGSAAGRSVGVLQAS